MKILIFTKEYNHEKVGICGGTGVFYRNLAQELKARNHDVFVFGSSKKPITFTDGGIHHHFVQHFFKKNKIAELFRSISGKFQFLEKFQTRFYGKENWYLANNLKKFIERNNLVIDIIETHDWDGTSLFLDHLQIPYIVRYHGSWAILKRYFGYKEIPAGKIECEKKASALSKNNITVSKYSDKITRETFFITDPVLIYNGIDYDYFCPNKNVKIIAKSIFYLGNLSYEKGADVALEVFLKIRKQFPQSTLHFVGTPNNYQKKVHPDFSADVIFHGRKSATELKLLMQSAEIVLFPSKGETFGLSLLEMMSLQKAVICSAIPAFEEIITDNENGMIAKDSDEFVKKAIFLFQSEKFREKIELEARRTVIEKFGMKRQIDETLKYYEKISRQS